MIYFLKDIEERLEALNIPIYYELPGPDVLEPFVVIGEVLTDSSPTAKVGKLLQDVNVQIDIFTPHNSRGKAELIKDKAIRLLGRRDTQSRITIDDSVGRNVYHTVIRLNDLI